MDFELLATLILVDHFPLYNTVQYFMCSAFQRHSTCGAFNPGQLVQIEFIYRLSIVDTRCFFWTTPFRKYSLLEEHRSLTTILISLRWKQMHTDTWLKPFSKSIKLANHHKIM